MPEPEPSDEDADDFLIYGAYGNVMHKFQVLELGLWSFQQIKPGATFDQAMAKVEKWNGTTFGDLMRGLKSQSHWPTDLLEQLLAAVTARNYLAHHFFIDYFLVVRSGENRDAAINQLAEMSVWIDQLNEELEAHASSLGLGVDEAELTDDIWALAESLRPQKWLDEAAQEVLQPEA